MLRALQSITVLGTKHDYYVKERLYVQTERNYSDASNAQLVEHLEQLLVERLVSAYVFSKYQLLSDDPEEYGLIKLGETENYKVYYDPEELEYVRSINYFYFK